MSAFGRKRTFVNANIPLQENIDEGGSCGSSAADRSVCGADLLLSKLRLQMLPTVTVDVPLSGTATYGSAVPYVLMIEKFVKMKRDRFRV